MASRAKPPTVKPIRPVGRVRHLPAQPSTATSPAPRGLDSGPSHVAAELRTRAEAVLRHRLPPDGVPLSAPEAQRLLHELQVQRIELEMQNEELQESRNTLAEVAARYTDLYDLAPVGYVTLDDGGAIVEANLAATRLLGIASEPLVGRKLVEFVADSDRRTFNGCIAGAFVAEGLQMCEVQLADHGRPRAVRVDATRFDKGAACRVVLHDISARQLQETEMRLLETCIAQVNDIVLVTDGSTASPGPRIVFANAACERITGYSRAELIGQSPRMLQGPDTDRAEVARIGTALQRREPVHAELLNYAKDGSRYWIELDITPVLAGDGSVTHFVAIQRDTTERHAVQVQMAQQEQALRRSEARSAKAEGLAGFGTWDWDLVGDSSTWSDALFGIYGRRVADGVPAFDAWQETIHPDDRPGLQACIDRALAGASHYAVDFRIFTKDAGVLRHIASRGESAADATGRVTRLWGIDRDITEHKQAEDMLRQNAEMTRRILHAAAVGLWEWNLLTNAVYFSPEWKQQLGYADDELANQFDEWQKRLHPDDLPRALTAVDDFLQGRVPRYAVEVRLRHKDGSWRWSYGEADLERNDMGVPVMMRGSQIDITERKQAEAATVELERKFREAQKMEAVGTLASSIAHDFNNIMGAILGNVALASNDLPADHPAMKSVAQIQAAGLRARSLVQKILSFTQRQAPLMQAQPLRGLVEEGIELLRATLPSGVTISRVMPAAPLVALVDATQVNQLLMNLGINAWHALKGQTGRIEVGLEALRFDATTLPSQPSLHPGLRPGLAAHLWVRDSGCGMTPEVMQRIFEPFFTTKMSGQGTGLGLAAVAGVVRSHGGVIEVDSTPGVGSCFHIYLPALETPVLAAGDQPAKAEGAPAALAANGQRVMYIDDDETMRLMVERLLERANFRVTCHADCTQALAVLRAAPLDFDLVITDYNMPQMSGLDVAREVAALRADLPVILTTGSLTDELIASALAAGISALVNKERTFEDLAPQALLVLAKSAR